MDGRHSHYDVLSVSRDATYDEIKESFHRLARAKHPDKQNRQILEKNNDFDRHGSGDCSAIDAENSAAEFRRIQQAWKVLRDPEERSVYDSDLLHKDLQEKNRQNGAIVLSYHDDLEEAIDEDTNESFMVYDCRCGEEIHIEETCPPCEFDGNTAEATCRQGVDDHILIDCPGCCFVYRIIGK